MHPPHLLVDILQEIGTVVAGPLIPYDEWVPLVMGQDVAPQNVRAKKEVERLELGPELEGVFGEDDGGDDGGADVNVDEEVRGHEGEGAGAHPSGGAAVFPPTPGLSQEVQQALDHSHNVVLGKTPSIRSRPPPRVSAALGALATPWVPMPLQWQQIKKVALKARKEVGGLQRHTGPQLVTPNLLPLGPNPPLLQEPMVPPGPLLLLLPLPPIYLLRSVSLTCLRGYKGASGGMTG